MSVTLQIQKLVYDIIKNDKYLSEIECKAYTSVPDTAQLPYVHIDAIKLSQLPYGGSTKYYKSVVTVTVHDTQNSNKQCIVILDHLESILTSTTQYYYVDSISIININVAGKTITQDHKLNWYGSLELSIIFTT